MRLQRIQRKLGERLRELLDGAHLTVFQLCERSNIPLNVLQKWEAGELSPCDKLRRMATEALKVESTAFDSCYNEE